MAPLSRVMSRRRPPLMATPTSSPDVLAPRTTTPTDILTVTDTLVCVVKVSPSDAVVDSTARSFSKQPINQESPADSVTTTICPAPISTEMDEPLATAPSNNAPSAVLASASIIPPSASNNGPASTNIPAATFVVSDSSTPPASSASSFSPQLLPQESEPVTVITTIPTSVPVATVTGSNGSPSTVFQPSSITSTIVHTPTFGPNAGSGTSSHASAHSHANVGAIVGSVLGGLVTLAAFFGCFLLIRRRSRSQRQARELKTSIDALAFLPIPGLGRDGLRSTSEVGASRSAGTPLSTRFVRALSGKGRGAQPVPVINQPSTERPVEVYVHSDGGRAPVEDNSGPEELPPTYDSIKGRGHKV